MSVCEWFEVTWTLGNLTWKVNLNIELSNQTFALGTLNSEIRLPHTNFSIFLEIFVDFDGFKVTLLEKGILISLLSVVRDHYKVPMY